MSDVGDVRPLTAEERKRIAEIIHPAAYGHRSDVARYEATVRAVEAERDALRERVERLRGALGRIEDLYGSAAARNIAHAALRADEAGE